MLTKVPEINKSDLENFDLLDKALEEHGVLIIKDFVGKDVLTTLVDEFHKALLQNECEYIRPMQYSIGKACNVIREKIDKNSLPVTYSVFSSTWMQRVVEGYLKCNFILNKEIFFVKDVVGSKHVANDLHFDVQPTFKFFIYLNDTTAKNGAFACVPGSHKKADEIRKKLGDKVSYENRELTRDLPYTEKDAVAVEGNAGSLIIFDTNVFHRAGNVSEGERWVMRGHTRPSKESPRGFMSKLRSLFKSR